MLLTKIISIKYSTSFLIFKMNKYIVIPGNNSRMLIKPALDKRGNWAEASEAEAADLKANFIWKPTVYPSKVIFK